MTDAQRALVWAVVLAAVLAALAVAAPVALTWQGAKAEDPCIDEDGNLRLEIPCTHGPTTPEDQGDSALDLYWDSSQGPRIDRSRALPKGYDPEEVSEVLCFMGSSLMGWGARGVHYPGGMIAFIDQATGKDMRVTGDCVVTEDVEP